MSWISPNFGSSTASSNPPPKKKIKKTNGLENENLPVVHQSPSCNWLQLYKPKSIDELAVNRKKVKEIETWLELSLNINSERRFLLLTGPSGCGKTITLQTVCKVLGFKILEWINPLDKPAVESEFPSRFEFRQSEAKLFEEYLFRSSRYSSCLHPNHSKKLVLVKDFPNVFLHNPTAFQEILERFADKCLNPVVFILSDECLCRKLFQTKFKVNRRLETITLNPIPDKNVSKILKSIMLQEKKINKNITMLPDEALSAISYNSHGDLRHAISMMYFSTINSKYDIAQLSCGGKFRNKAKCHENTSVDKDDKIDFFHGIGRVLYPKKIKLDKGFKFVHSSDAIVDRFLSEPITFINQLHENYPTKLGNVYDLADSAERLAKSDILITRWQDKDQFHNYALSVAVRGLMVYNRNPQKAKFEAFRKSQTSLMAIDSKATELEGKSLFCDMCDLDYKTLMDILPYSNPLLPNLNSGQLEYVRRTFNFK